MLTTYFTGIFLALLVSEASSTVRAANRNPGPEQNPQRVRLPHQNFRSPFFPRDSKPGHCHSPQPYPPYSTFSGSIFSNVPSVAIFANKFTQAVYSSDILRDVFDLSQATTLQYSDFVYEYNLDLYKRRGFKNANEIAEFAALGIATYFDVLTLPLMVRVLHNTAGNFLFTEGILNIKCAEKIALAYADIIESYAQANLTEDTSSKFKILADTFFNFIVSIDNNLKVLFPVTTRWFGIEWFVAGVNYKWINEQ